jgi:alanine-glyoxylate transaminase/serine-glyoxylate transaminase/serine-pyruvate transaminase
MSVGIENAWNQHQEIYQYFAQEMESRGWKFFVSAENRLPQLNTVLLPEGFDDMTNRSLLREKFNIEVGGGLGAMAGKLWRIGIMGGNVNRVAVDELLKAIDSLSK